jgi:hypothetical protein
MVWRLPHSPSGHERTAGRPNIVTGRNTTQNKPISRQPSRRSNSTSMASGYSIGTNPANFSELRGGAAKEN